MDKNLPIDRFTVGHALFGFMAAGFYWVTIDFFKFRNYLPEIYFYYIGILLNLCIFIAWEILEHSIVKKYIYIRMMRMGNWKETWLNALCDILIAECIALIYAINVFNNSLGITFNISSLIIGHLLIPIVVFFVNDGEKKQIYNYNS